MKLNEHFFGDCFGSNKFSLSKLVLTIVIIEDRIMLYADCQSCLTIRRWTLIPSGSSDEVSHYSYAERSTIIFLLLNSKDLRRSINLKLLCLGWNGGQGFRISRSHFWTLNLEYSGNIIAQWFSYDVLWIR